MTVGSDAIGMTQASSTAPVGLVGLGNIGSAMLARLTASGPVVGYDVDPVRREMALQTGAILADSVAEVASRCGVVILSLPRPDISQCIVEEISRLPRAYEQLVIETSTITAEQANKMHQIASASGLGYVDAAILSGVGEVADGSSCFLVGGSEPDVIKALPILHRICARYLLLGGPGSGMAAKVINNAVAHAVMVVLAEAAALGRASGISLDQLCALLSQTDAGLKRPLSARLAGRYRDGKFDGGMPTEVARKDSALALDMARSSGVPLFAIQAADVVYEIAVASGLSRKDYAAIVTLWDTWRQGPRQPV